MNQRSENKYGGIRDKPPQLNCFVIVCNTEIIDTQINKLFAYFFYAVTVSICFDYTADFNFFAMAAFA